MWSVVKSIRASVLDVFCNGRENKVLELEVTLNKHKNLLLSPLQPPGKNADHRTAVKQAVTEPISLEDVGPKVLLTQEFVDEVVILSDLFNVDELIVVELLLTAESQVPQYSNISRGLLAVTLYYDANVATIDILRTLIQACPGRTWSPSISAECTRLAEKFTADLWSSGLLQNILHLTRKFNVVSEFSRLDSARALGSSKHRYDVFNMLQTIQNGLSECVMLWTCQSAFTLDELKLVVEYLCHDSGTSVSTLDGTNPSSSTEPMRDLDHSKVHLIVSLLYMVEPLSVLSTVPEKVDDLTSFDLAHPLFSDRKFGANFTAFLNAKRDSVDKLNNADVSDQLSLLALIRLAWAVCLRRTSHLRCELCRRHYNRLAQSPTESPLQDASEGDARNTGSNDFSVDEDDEPHLNLAIDSGALEFLRKRVLTVNGFEREPLWTFRVHSLITELVIHWPTRIKEIRLHDEDLLRRTGFDPSSSGSGFANILLLIAKLYGYPGSKLHARLALEFWWPMGELAAGANNLTGISQSTTDVLSKGLLPHSPFGSNYVPTVRANESESFRQASLLRFIRLAGDLATTPSLFIPYLQMLHGLVGSRSSANFCFSLLKSNSANQGRTASLVSWDHFFSSFHQYLNHMKQPVASTSPPATFLSSKNQSAHQIYPHLYTSGLNVGSLSRLSSTDNTFHPGGSTGVLLNTPVRAIQPEEQAGLQAVLQLIARIARMDPLARSLFVSNTNWQALPTFFGLLTCPVPLALKADLLHVFTALSRSPTIANLVWGQIVTSEILPIVQPRTGSHTAVPCGLHTEMDEVEPRVEEYPVTRAFLALVTTLASNVPHACTNISRISDGRDARLDDSGIVQGQTLVSVVSFITNSVFLKHPMRAYRDPNERWDIAASCLVLFDGLVDHFVQRLNSAASAVGSSTPGDVREGSFQSTTEFAGLNRLNLLKSDSASDWASILISTLWELTNGLGTQSTSWSSIAELLASLRLPAGWPRSDPGFVLASNLLGDSSLFRTITGLLEVGLHRLLELPIPNGPPIGMVRATAAALCLFERILAYEDILLVFVRRTAVEPSFPAQLSTVTKPVPLPDLPTLNTLPTSLSRLLMSVNSRTGRADLLPMLLKYCTLSEALPDHCALSMNILGHLLDRIRPHSDLLSMLTADPNTQAQLLSAFSSMLNLPAVAGPLQTLTASPRAVSMNSDCFTDEWLFSGDEVEKMQLTVLGVSSDSLQHPAALAARNFAMLPNQPPHWAFPSVDWELLTAWPPVRPSVLLPLVQEVDYSQSSDFNMSGRQNSVTVSNWLFDWLIGVKPLPFAVLLVHVLQCGLNFPAPNLTHWFLGFRTESAQATSRTVLQDAGIADQPRTCLHALLDLFNAELRRGSSSFSLPKVFAPSLQWILTVGWQIVYRLAADPLTSEPLLRFLRGNHDLLAKHLKFGLFQSIPPAVEPLTGTTMEMTKPLSYQSVLELLSLNQASWLLRTAVIEVRTAFSGNQKSYVVKLLKALFGDVFSNSSSTELGNMQESCALLSSFLDHLHLADALFGPDSFELRSFDARYVDELIVKCELVCPLLSSESSAVRKISTILNPKVFFNRLYLKLLCTRNAAGSLSSEDLAGIFSHAYSLDSGQTSPLRDVASEHSLGTALTQDLNNLRQWVDARNVHRLQLFGGKQAAFEAWRQMAEVSLEVLLNPSTISSLASYAVPSRLLSLNDDLLGRLGGDHTKNQSGLRSPNVICLDFIHRLLLELCQKTTTPSTIRLLASGTLLHISSYLNPSNVFTPRDNDQLQSHCVRKESVSLLARSIHALILLILRTKSSAQRMRANFYGTLSFLLKFARCIDCTEDQVDSTATECHAIDECLSAVSAASRLQSCQWAQNEFLKSSTASVSLSSFHCLLGWDLIRGHPVTEMAVMCVLELLLSVDRSPRDLLSFICQPAVLQCLIEDIPDHLATIEAAISPCSSPLCDTGVVVPSEETVNNATSAFHMYRAKLSVLCRLATLPSAAKALIHSDLINRLTECSIFSVSNLSNCFSDGLDYLNGSASITRRLNLPNTLFKMFQYYSTDGCITDESVLQRLLSICADASNAPENSGGVTWSGILLPAVRLFKALLITVGSYHLSAHQQLYNFLYTHSDSLIVGDLALGHAVAHVTGRLDNLPSIFWLTDWLAAQTSLTELFVVAARYQLTTAAADEYSVLQRDVVQSRLLRNTLTLLPNLLAEEVKPGLAPGTESQSRTGGLDFLVFVTQHVQLIRQLVALCAASLSSTSELIPATEVKASKMRLLFSFLNQRDSHATQMGVNLLFQVFCWSFDRLAALEEICLSLVRLNIFGTSSKSDACRIPDKLSSTATYVPDNTAVRLLLRYERPKQQIPIDELRQAAAVVFNTAVSTSSASSVLLGADETHRESCNLSSLLFTGISLIRLQLSSLLDICEQTAYITWRYLDFQLSHRNSHCHSLGTTPQVSTGRNTVRHLENNSGAQSSQNRSPCLRTNYQEPSDGIEIDDVLLKTQLKCLLSSQVIENLGRLSKLTYLEPSRQLFLRVIQCRLERMATKSGAVLGLDAS